LYIVWNFQIEGCTIGSRQPDPPSKWACMHENVRLRFKAMLAHADCRRHVIGLEILLCNVRNDSAPVKDCSSAECAYLQQRFSLSLSLREVRARI
jgi:hypothetical protein